jgi:prepilin-type N-terminal cleavage/methylation domain-containing protein
MYKNNPIFKRHLNSESAFTIVELLIVIVIIGILAALVIVAFNGVEARARDTKRKTDLSLIKKALQLYGTDNGNFIGTGSGCGAAGGGQGYFNYEDGVAGGYPISIYNCLKNANYLSGAVADPKGQTSCGGLSCYTYMKYNCGSITYVFAHLESVPQTATDTDATCQPTLDTSYGVNYFVQVE